MARRFKQLIKLGIILIVLLALGVGALFLTLRLRPLLTFSKRVSRIGNVAYHLWTPDRHLLIFTPDYSGVISNSNLSNLNIYRMVSAANGGTLLGTITVNAMGAISTFRLSPNADYLFDANSVPTGDQPGMSQLYVKDLENGRFWSIASSFAVWPTNALLRNISPISAAWWPDSRRLVELHPEFSSNDVKFYGYQLKLHSLDTPDVGGVLMPIDPGVRTLLGVTPRGRLIATDFYLQPNKVCRTIKVFQSGLYPDPEEKHQFTISLPDGAEILEMRLSPQGDHLAWVLRFTGDSSLRKLMRRYVPLLAKNMGSGQTNDLWVSQVDGQEMHRVGAQPIRPGVARDAAPHDVQWTPDGKFLSFLSSGDVYTVSSGY